MRTNQMLCGIRTMTESEVIIEFAKKEKRLTVLFAVSFVMFGVTLLFNAVTETYINPTIPFLIGFGLIFYGLYNYRCPNCNHMPAPLGGSGIQISPKKCGTCGVKLR